MSEEKKPVEKVKLQFVGKGTYRGIDPHDNHETVHVEKGGVVEVSEGKAKQLLADFPKEWEEVEADEPKAKGKK